MGVTVLGIQHRVGEFQGVHYDNYNLHCVEEVSGDTWQRGSRITYVEKVPADVYYQANAVDQILPGHEYNIVHNRYGRPIDVQLIKWGVFYVPYWCFGRFGSRSPQGERG